MLLLFSATPAEAPSESTTGTAGFQVATIIVAVSS